MDYKENKCEENRNHSECTRDMRRQEMIDQIKSVYAEDVSDRYDIMEYIDSNKKEKEEKSNDVLSLILILAIIGGVGFGIYKLRESSK